MHCRLGSIATPHSATPRRVIMSPPAVWSSGLRSSGLRSSSRRFRHAHLLHHLHVKLPRLLLLLSLLVSLLPATLHTQSAGAAAQMSDFTAAADYRAVIGREAFVFEPATGAYPFGADSDQMECSFRQHPMLGFQEGTLRLYNGQVKAPLVTVKIDRVLGATIRFRIRNITMSSQFICQAQLTSVGYIETRVQAQVYVLTDAAVSCSNNKQCWGYGRNALCNTNISTRCMCSLWTGRTSSNSPICTDVIREGECNQLCRNEEQDCTCSQISGIIIKDTEYDTRSIASSATHSDEVEFLQGSEIAEYKFLKRQEMKCIRCVPGPQGLPNLQVGLFLVGAVLAFTAVTLMAVVIRKMWLYYRIPPDLLEASRDIERQTIEREAEQMAQRDKPPSYIEVMEGDLQISGYPPPDYEELASAMRRQYREVEHRRQSAPPPRPPPPRPPPPTGRHRAHPNISHGSGRSNNNNNNRGRHQSTANTIGLSGAGSTTSGRWRLVESWLRALQTRGDRPQTIGAATARPASGSSSVGIIATSDDVPTIATPAILRSQAPSQPPLSTVSSSVSAGPSRPLRSELPSYEEAALSQQPRQQHGALVGSQGGRQQLPVSQQQQQQQQQQRY